MGVKTNFPPTGTTGFWEHFFFLPIGFFGVQFFDPCKAICLKNSWHTLETPQNQEHVSHLCRKRQTLFGFSLKNTNKWDQKTHKKHFSGPIWDTRQDFKTPLRGSKGALAGKENSIYTGPKLKPPIGILYLESPRCGRWRLPKVFLKRASSLWHLPRPSTGAFKDLKTGAKTPELLEGLAL